MAIGTITMILANVGLSIFNNWAGSRQNKQIAEKREEFERAAREGQRERMLQLMREGQQLTLELEEQKHKERLSELNDQFDNLIKELAYSAAIEHWPLKTLPIVMKNQALGNLLANQEEKVALHCILTSSNCREFNDYVLPKVESALEAYCNVHWSTLTGSPVLFYSGAWKSNDIPTGTQVDSMRAALSNLPTLLFTPFFRPQDHKLVFQAHVWGVGYNNSDQFTIPVIEPTEFQRDYTDELGWLAEDGLIEEAVEDLVPYLQCLIGYIADTYFWSAFGSVPQLPRMLTDGTINTDGMKYLVDDACGYYSNLLTTSEKKSIANPFADDNLLSLFEGIYTLWDEETKKQRIEELFVSYCNKKGGNRFLSINDVINKCSFNITYKSGINSILQYYKGPYVNYLENKCLAMDGLDFDYSILKCNDRDKLLQLANNDDAIALYRLGELYEFSIGVKNHPDFALDCYSKSANMGFILAELKEKIENNEAISDLQTEKLQLLHNAGIEQASILLAKKHFYGLGCQIDKDKSITILNCVQNSKHPYYYYTGAIMLMEAFGDEEKNAIYKLLKVAADMGYVKAIEKLMMVYTIDDFVPHNPQKHFEYAQKAAEQGSLLGITRLGYCYASGFGVSKNTEQAIKVLKIAEKRNFQDAIKLLNILISKDENK